MPMLLHLLDEEEERRRLAGEPERRQVVAPPVDVHDLLAQVAPELLSGRKVATREQEQKNDQERKDGHEYDRCDR